MGNGGPQRASRADWSGYLRGQKSARQQQREAPRRGVGQREVGGEMRTKRWVCGGVAAGVIGLTSIFWGSPSQAQEGELLEATVSPEVAAPGDAVTATSVDPCVVDPMGSKAIVLQVTRRGEGPAVRHVDDEASEDGAWSVTFPAPTEIGEYDLRVWCPGSDFNDYFEQFSVRPAGTTTSTTGPSSATTTVPSTSAAPTAPAATPVIAAPNFTG